MKCFKNILVTFFCGFLLTACQGEPQNVLKVGTISGPEAQLMTVVKNYAAINYGLDIEIVEYPDYSGPNAALSKGKIDANVFEHMPYLASEIKTKHYDNLVAVAKTFIYPMAIYSTKIDNINKIPPNAVIAIPNDPSNEGRALILLSTAGLITLKPNAGYYGTIADIISNPKKLVLEKLDAAQLVAALDNVTAAVINANYAVAAGLFPGKNALYIENKSSPYVNLVVIRADNVTNPKIQQLIAALHSPEVVNAAQEIFDGGAMPAW